MNLISFNQTITIIDVNVPAHIEHVYPTNTSSRFRKELKDHIESSRPLGFNYRKYNGQKLNGKKLLLWRTGGYGDMLMISPLIKRLMQLYPKAEINFACRPPFREIFWGNPTVKKVYLLPVPLPLLKKHDYHLHFENTLEKSKNPKLHAVDLFGKHAKVKINDKKPVFVFNNSRKKKAEEYIRQTLGIPESTKIVAIQTQASSIIRTYPPDMLVQVVKGLAEHGIATIAFGTKSIEADTEGIPNFYDLCGKFKEIYESIAIMSFCDSLIAPDSSFTHFAAALDVPTVALYGPFPGAVRTKYYPRCVTIEAKAPCAPCFIHSGKPCPEAQKEGKTWSPCFRDIEPGRVVDETLNLIQ